MFLRNNSPAKNNHHNDHNHNNDNHNRETHNSQDQKEDRKTAGETARQEDNQPHTPPNNRRRSPGRRTEEGRRNRTHGKPE